MLTPLEQEALDTLQMVLNYFSPGRSPLRRDYLDVMGTVRDTVGRLKDKQAKQSGYTLIELVLVVAIISVLSMVVVPKISQTIRRAQESRTKANLAVLRSSLAMYYSVNGTYPLMLEELVTGPCATLRRIPYKNTPPYHSEGNTVTNAGVMGLPGSVGAWFYFNVPGQNDFGKVVVNCVHRDMRGRVWTTL